MPSTTFGELLGDWDQPAAEQFVAWGQWYAALGWYPWPTRGMYPPAPGRCTCYKGAECRGAGKHGRPGWRGDISQMPVRTPEEQADRVARYWGPDGDWPEGVVDNLAVLPHLSGLLVVDFDGLAQWEKYAGLLGGVETLTEVSGRDDGGWHLFFAYPLPYPEYRLRQTIPGTPVEIKHRSLVLTTPSLHKSGRQYRWVDPSVPTAAAPELLTQPAAERSAALESGLLSESDADAIRLECDPDNRWAQLLLASDLAGVARLAQMAAKSGGRPSRAHAVAFYLAPWTLGGALSEAQVVEMLLDACERNGACADYGADDIERQIRNGLSAGRASAVRARRDKEAM